MKRFRMCLICDKGQLSREFLPLHTGLEKHFELTRHYVDDKWPLSIGDLGDHREFDIVVWFVKFRDLVTKPDFDWGKFSGVRVMYDFDAYQNFSTMAGGGRYLGAWPREFARHRFDVLACTGKATRDNLLEAGVNAVWVPKAYDHERFHDKGEQRQGICYFGELYEARAEMLKYLKARDAAVTRFKCAYFDLNDNLNRFEICLICNMVVEQHKGSLLRILPLLRPAAKLHPGPEVMQKNFEVAGSGCISFCDAIPELGDLGFTDGENMVTYGSFDELLHKLRLYGDSPDALRTIRSNALTLSIERHTWDKRMQMFIGIASGDPVELDGNRQLVG